MPSVIKVSHTISMGHRLPSYKGICSSPHGHNVKVEVCIRTTKFFDFKVVKDLLVEVIQPMDHAMVLHNEDPIREMFIEMEFRHVLLNVEPTTENIAQVIFNILYKRLRQDASVSLDCVTVHETDKYTATAHALDPKVSLVTFGS